jgi:hypothetical protein
VLDFKDLGTASSDSGKSEVTSGRKSGASSPLVLEKEVKDQTTTTSGRGGQSGRGRGRGGRKK